MRTRSLALATLVVTFALAACSSGDSGSLTGFHSSTGDGTGNGSGNGTGTGNGNGSGDGDGTGTGGPSGTGGGSGVDGGAITSPDGGGGGGNGDSGGGGGGSDASSSADTSAPNDGFDQFQHHNLDVVNQYRATLNVAPLVLDATLCTFAAAGSTELSQDHAAHQHFIDASNDGSIWKSGFKSNAAENQGDPNGWPSLSKDATQNTLLQIDDIQKAMFDEGPGAGEAHGHYTNMMNPKLKRLGVGLLEVSGGELYLTNDFSD